MAQSLTKLLAIIVLIILMVTPPLAAKPSALMFPPDAITSNDYYRDWYGPTLKDLEERPLWTGSKAVQGKEVIRFTFIPGPMRLVGRHATVVRIEIGQDEARLLARTQANDHGEMSIRKVAKKRLTSLEVSKLHDLITQAEPWKFAVGTWEEKGRLSIHCTELIMERRQPSGYAVSQILISCTQPDRLMPLVDYVAALAGQSREDLRY